MIDILIVTFRPDMKLIREQLESICLQYRDHCPNLYIWDNSENEQVVCRLEELLGEYEDRFLSSSLLNGDKNIGFGNGHNHLIKISSSPWILILNQEVTPEPGCVENLLSIALQDDEGCAWEARQIPYEHPKIYDPVTLETPWVSCAACLFRRRAIEKVNGFERRIFMYGEDVDLSWRLRAAGWKLRYVPRAADFHNTYAIPGERKPLQAIEGTLTNLCLRARFGTFSDIVKGIMLLMCEVIAPQSFPGRRRSIARVFFRFFKVFKYYRRESCFRGKGFKPTFLGWNYALHREGAFFPFKGHGTKSGYPLVSILVRTCNRPGRLKEALLSIKHQTYPNIEVVVIEDGPPSAEKMVFEEFGAEMNLKYYSTGRPVGRARAGNLALERAGGKWLNFLDDDDLFFADHVDVLVQSVTGKNVKAAYSLAWETETEVVSEDPLQLKELSYNLRHRQRFCKITLWHHNFMPIQSVLFSRELYEKWGGLDEKMDQLEDWNLWTRYTLEDDFLFVDKSTSKYRVPAGFHDIERRQGRLDAAYLMAMERQGKMVFRSNPRAVSESIDAYVRSQTVLMITRGQIRSFVGRFAVTRWLMKQRGYFRGLWMRVRRRN